MLAVEKPLGAGRALDARVAVEVMKWRNDPAPNPPARTWLARTERSWYAPDSPYARALPAYSTDIAEAWSVVEEMWWEGWDVTVRCVSDGWIAEAKRFGNLSTLHQVGVDPRDGGAPLAICRLALAALSAEAPDVR